jgi:hypothetical protein
MVENMTHVQGLQGLGPCERGLGVNITMKPIFEMQINITVQTATVHIERDTIN